MNKFNSCQAIVCAAGLSSRMGQENKLLMPFRGMTILEYSLHQLIKCDISRIILITGYEHGKVLAAIGSLIDKIDWVYNDNFQQGHTSSIQAGVSQLDKKADSFMVCLGDMPLLHEEHYNQLLSYYRAASPHSIVRPVNGDRRGHPVIFDISYRDAILNCQSQEGCKEVIKQNKDHGRFFFSEDKAFYQDVDTPTSYELLLKNEIKN